MAKHPDLTSKDVVSGLSDFEVQPPSEAEMREIALRWWDRLKGTMLDDLPPDVMALSVPTHFEPFDPRAMAEIHGETRSEAEFRRLASALTGRCDFERHVMKLCSRSAKDTWENSGLSDSAVQSLAWMMPSERILTDCSMMARLPERNWTVAVREPFFGMEGPGTWEFRCFVRGGDLIAVSDYDYRDKSNKHMSNPEARKRVRAEAEGMHRAIHPHMDLADYVFDLVWTRDGWRLIEVNPYGLSDPCFLGSYAAVEAFEGDVAWKFPDDAKEDRDAD